MIDSIPEAQTVIYNQMIFISIRNGTGYAGQKEEPLYYEHPEPSNEMVVEDIKRVQETVARESKQLVYTHYNLRVCCDKQVDLQKPTNHLENCFGRIGIHISKRAYNQLNFSSTFPGKLLRHECDYTRFLTLGDANSPDVQGVHPAQRVKRL